MTPIKSLSLALGGAGIVAATLIGSELASSPAREEGGVFFDEVLRANRAACLPNGASSQSLIAYYQKVAAAKTELRPFPTEGAYSSARHLDTEPPLWDNLGEESWPITVANPRAQRYFDQGLRLAYAFNHAEARRAFRTAQRLDPDCAMCYWGEALVLGPNINAPMEDAALAPALAALRQAQARAGSTSAKEQALIAALGKRYSDDPNLDRATLDAAYAEAMGEVTARFADDEQIVVLYAEALMDLQPWDYWAAGGAEPKGKTAEILTLLEGVLADNPDHPGAIHYYIHVVEASTQPERAEAYARRLPAAMPGAGHLVHMPFHVLYRIGKYQDALAANKDAVAADEVYLAQASPEGLYPQAYHPHNVHSLMVSAQMAGESGSAIGAAYKLVDIVSDEVARSIPWVQPIKVAPYFAHAQFSAPDTVLALSDPGDSLPYVKAMWHYARGIAFAGKGNAPAARSEAEAIARLGENTDFSALTAGGVPAPELLDLARHVVLGRVSQAQGDFKTARGELEAAVAIEDELAYMEPPFWYYPVRQTLGAVLLQMGKAREAETVFLESLLRVPNNGWALYGLAETYQQLGDKRAAAKAQQRFQQAWAGEPRTLDLARL
ncbi:MAG: tetratricopeptide repeat protein [Gammaproteobacteria bacterium]